MPRLDTIDRNEKCHLSQQYELASYLLLSCSSYDEEPIEVEDVHVGYTIQRSSRLGSAWGYGETKEQAQEDLESTWQGLLERHKEKSRSS